MTSDGEKFRDLVSNNIFSIAVTENGDDCT